MERAGNNWRIGKTSRWRYDNLIIHTNKLNTILFFRHWFENIADIESLFMAIGLKKAASEFGTCVDCWTIFAADQPYDTVTYLLLARDSSAGQWHEELEAQNLNLTDRITSADPADLRQRFSVLFLLFPVGDSFARRSKEPSIQPAQRSCTWMYWRIVISVYVISPIQTL